MLVAYGGITRSINNDLTKNQQNNLFAAEFKTASDERKGEILSEYLELNKKFCTTFLNWGEEYWLELTSMFVAYWPAAFMRYTPYNDKSVFNFYMDQNYKRRACVDLRNWLKRENHSSLELVSSDGDVYERRCLSIPFDTYLESSMLKERIERVLDLEERRVFDASFYAGLNQYEVAESLYPVKKYTGSLAEAKARRRRKYKALYETMLQKIRNRFKKEELL